MGNSNDGLADLLERCAELQDEKAKAEAILKDVNRRLGEIERLAVEALAVSGLDGCRAAGKTWSLREFHAVSIPAENKEAVLKAARKACPEFISVNTSSLKSWLEGERKRVKEETGEEIDAPLSHGTPFAGLISEYSEMRLSSRKLS